jgi:hypothetical protein
MTASVEFLALYSRKSTLARRETAAGRAGARSAAA